MIGTFELYFFIIIIIYNCVSVYLNQTPKIYQELLKLNMKGSAVKSMGEKCSLLNVIKLVIMFILVKLLLIFIQFHYN